MPIFDDFRVNYDHLGKVLQAKSERSMLHGSQPQTAIYVNRCGINCPFFTLGNRDGYFRCSVTENGRLQKADISFLTGEEKFPENCPLQNGVISVKISAKSETSTN
jgi:hypothetical protein